MERPDNLILVIFGATGDLTSRMLIPALYSLKILNMMPESFALIGSGRSELTSDEFRKKMEKAIQTFSEEKDLTPETDFQILQALSTIVPLTTQLRKILIN